MISSHISAIKEKEGHSNGQETIGRLQIWGGLHSFDYLPLPVFDTTSPGRAAT